MRGMCIDKAELAFLIREAAIRFSTRPSISDDFPNKSFVDRWLKKHEATVSLRKARILDTARANASTEPAVRRYYSNLKAVVDELGLGDSPERIWNCDETGVCAQGRCQQRVITPKGIPANVQRSSDRENVSIMGCINADGGFIPPMYIFAGKRSKIEWMEGAPEGAKSALSETSNINGSLFWHWFDWFVKTIPPTRPQLLILDGHFAHLDHRAVRWGLEQGVHIFTLPTHTSHFLQPLDVGVYQPFKRLYETELSKFSRVHGGAMPLKDDLPCVTCRPFEQAFSKANIKSGFARSGIYPLSVNVMLRGVVGNEPPTSRDLLPHHTFIMEEHAMPQLTSRQAAKLQQQGLNWEAVVLVNVAIKNSATPYNKSRPPGTFVDVNFSGGVLLTHAEMAAATRKKEEYKMYAAAAKASKPLEANERATVNMHDKPKHYTTNTRKNIRAATPKRPRVAKTANAKRPKYMDVVVV